MARRRMTPRTTTRRSASLRPKRSWPTRAVSAIVIGGSGNGEQIAANKVDGVRAALAWSTETAELARMHNDANVVSIGARMHSIEEATIVRRDLPGHRLHRRGHGTRGGSPCWLDYEETGQVPSADA